ncbi:MAG: TRAP transporter small permease [Spirochaetales bacterium]|nr:TRAP transporter small permease [Spirochaetales bacterium]
MKAVFHIADKIKPFYDLVDKVVLFVCKILLIVDIVITTMAVTGRYVSFIPDPAWSEEVVLTCMAYMAVLSAALAIRRNSHIRMTAFDRFLPKKLVHTLDFISDIAVMILGFIMIFVGWNYAQRLGSRGFYVSMPGLSRFWMYFPVPLAGVAMVIFEIEMIYNRIRHLVMGDDTGIPEAHNEMEEAALEMDEEDTEK